MFTFSHHTLDLPQSYMPQSRQSVAQLTLHKTDIEYGLCDALVLTAYHRHWTDREVVSHAPTTLGGTHSQINVTFNIV